MNTFKITPEEMYQLILECRRSGMTDLNWCNAKGIKFEAFRTWVRRLKRDPTSFPIPPATVTSSCRLPANEAVQPDALPEENLQEPDDDKNTFIPPAMAQTAPSIEIETHGVTVRFFGPVDASLYEKALLMLGDISLKNIKERKEGK